MVNTFTFDLLSLSWSLALSTALFPQEKRKKLCLILSLLRLGVWIGTNVVPMGGVTAVVTVTRKIVITPICLLSFDQEWKFFPFWQKLTFCLFSFLIQKRFLKRVKSLVHPAFSDIIQMFSSNWTRMQSWGYRRNLVVCCHPHASKLGICNKYF